MDYVSYRTKDHFDFVISENLIYSLPNSPDRCPDEGNGGYEPDDPPPTELVPTNQVFIATQPEVSEKTVARYAHDLKCGAEMPPVAGIKCPDGIIVWNGHHRLSAHRLAGKEYVPVRFWAEIEQSVLPYAEIEQSVLPYKED